MWDIPGPAVAGRVAGMTKFGLTPLRARCEPHRLINEHLNAEKRTALPLIRAYLTAEERDASVIAPSRRCRPSTCRSSLAGQARYARAAGMYPEVLRPQLREQLQRRVGFPSRPASPDRAG